MLRQVIATAEVAKPGGPYSQAVRVGALIFLSGQAGTDKTGTLKSGIEAQTSQALDNVRAILAACGTTLADVAQVVAYLADLRDYQKMNAVYSRYFLEDPPARATIQAVLPVGVLVEFVVTAQVG
ncbi:MAG: Rid family detoxifying hydrolase [candidate division NC10 bacterium]